MHELRLKAVLCHNAMDISDDLHVATRYPMVVRFLIQRLRFLGDLVPWLPVPLRILVNWNDVVEGKSLLRSLLRDENMVWYYSLGSWNSFLKYPRVQFSQIAVPVKLIVGTEDRLFPPEYCRRLALRIGPQGAAFETVGGGHALPLESVPQTIFIAARWFEEKLVLGA
jgi:pimeloyl-ACP methyl ester carboxylesterase